MNDKENLKYHAAKEAWTLRAARTSKGVPFPDWWKEKYNSDETLFEYHDRVDREEVDK